MFLSKVLAFDYAVHTWFNTIQSDLLTTFFNFVTLFGSASFVIPCAVVVAAMLYIKARRQYIIPLWIILITAEAVVFVIKHIVARPRALDALVTENSFSFPSGHAYNAVALYGFLTYIVLHQVRTSWKRKLILVGGVSGILLIGLSRLYLGAHYVSDIVAGYLFGSMTLLMGIYIIRRMQ